MGAFDNYVFTKTVDQENVWSNANGILVFISARRMATAHQYVLSGTWPKNQIWTPAPIYKTHISINSPSETYQVLDFQDSLAEWSKALASGASPQGRGFEPHSCHMKKTCLARWNYIATLVQAQKHQSIILSAK
jgi:hypothetical protein